MPSIDFSAVEDLKPIPDGNYLASITSAKAGMSANNNPKIDLTWKVEQGEFEGRNVFDTLTFTAKSAYRVKMTLMALDFPEDFSGEVTPDDLIGKTAYILVKIESSTAINEQTGEPYGDRNRVQRVKSASSGKAAAGKPSLGKLLS